jgi:hypothetical protein
MNKGKLETAGVDDSLDTFWSYRKYPADGIRGQPKSSNEIMFGYWAALVSQGVGKITV